jgi:hypothetical protein
VKELTRKENLLEFLTVIGKYEQLLNEARRHGSEGLEDYQDEARAMELLRHGYWKSGGLLVAGGKDLDPVHPGEGAAQTRQGVKAGAITFEKDLDGRVYLHDGALGPGDPDS